MASQGAMRNEAKAEEMYKKMDTDSKEGVSLAEFTAAIPAPGKGKPKKENREG